MRPPAFWDNAPETPGLAARLLAPLAALFAGATALRVGRGPSERPGPPVICVGNLHAGGTGKTPTVIALIERLAKAGLSAHVVTRGHGGRLAGPLRVDLRHHRSADVGDEPLLLAAFAPVWVARDRAAGARAAAAAGAEAILLDDGFQNPAVAKDMSLVVVDADHGFGNGRVMPAGPLREPVATGLARADFVLAIGDTAARARFTERWGAALPCPLLEAELVPLATGIDWSAQRVLAFAGIGRPARFFATLRGLGADVAGTVALSDHQPLPETLLQRLSRQAAGLGAQLVTTEKDAARLPAAWRGQVLALPVRLQPGDWHALDTRMAAITGR